MSCANSCCVDTVNYTKPGAHRPWTGSGMNIIKESLPSNDWWVGVMNPAPEKTKECFETSKKEYRGIQSRYHRR
jgi:hypothetical protein